MIECDVTKFEATAKGKLRELGLELVIVFGGIVDAVQEEAGADEAKKFVAMITSSVIAGIDDLNKGSGKSFHEIDVNFTENKKFVAAAVELISRRPGTDG